MAVEGDEDPHGTLSHRPPPYRSKACTDWDRTDDDGLRICGGHEPEGKAIGVSECSSGPCYPVSVAGALHTGNALILRA